MKFEKIAIVGMGYIGLPTAAVIANEGISVTGIDINRHAVDTINRGEIHIVEPDLDRMVRQAVMSGKLRASATPEPADAFLIAVPTPFKGNHEPDISYVEAAALSIAPVLAKGNLIILESTSPVGTTEHFAKLLASKRSDLRFPQHDEGENADIQIAYCPERVLPGHILRELIENDRIIGGLTAQCANRAASLYKIFVKGSCIETDARTAEMVKLTENSFRDVNIAFANELSLICDKLGINVWELIRLANHHPRVNILQPGPGVGGHCIAVDPWFIVHSAPEQARLIRAAREVNDSKPHHVLKKIREAAASITNPVIACLGLAFKADIDDLRESPSLDIVHELGKEGFARLLVVEPHINALPAELAVMPNVELLSLDEAIKRADVVVLLVNHKVFVGMGKNDLQGKTVIDTRGVWV
jgi:UDP-N-acetyl-D-mannosaminuronic acid dehydrogenase